MEFLIQFIFYYMQERQTGRDTSRSDPDYQQDDHVVVKIADKHLNEGTSDTSEGDTGRNQRQPTRWR